MQHDAARLLLGVGLVGIVGVTGLVGLSGLAGFAARVPREAHPARFTVRGRWPGERVIGYRVEARDAALRTAVQAALAQWEETGCVLFFEAETEAELVFAWERAGDDECATLGLDPGVAHAGPVGPGTFVHFEPERAWGPELSLQQAALHEIGHVLGLGHSPDEGAVMFPEPSARRARLGASDRAGIHSLYGGGVESNGDLVVTEGVALRGVAPRGSTDWTVFDVDGDGDAEVLVWSTVAAGNGALWEFHFARGPVLERTVGPLYGAVGPGVVEFGVGLDGERWVVVETEVGAVTRVFDAEGIPRVIEGEVGFGKGLGGLGDGVGWGDLDGDGVVEGVGRVR